MTGVEECADCGVALVPPEPAHEPPPWKPMPLEADGESVVLLRTGRVMEADMVVQALEEAGIPHYREEVGSGLLDHHTPLAPAAGSGIWWVVQIPASRAEEARSVLEQLPFETRESADAEAFGSSEKEESGVKSWALAWLVLIVVFIFFAVLSLIRDLF